MQTIRIQFSGDGDINIQTERQVADEQALSLYRRLRDILLADGAPAKRKGRRASVTNDETSGSDATSENDEG